MLKSTGSLQRLECCSQPYLVEVTMSFDKLVRCCDAQTFYSSRDIVATHQQAEIQKLLGITKKTIGQGRFLNNNIKVPCTDLTS